MKQFHLYSTIHVTRIPSSFTIDLKKQYSTLVIPYIFTFLDAFNKENYWFGAVWSTLYKKITLSLWLSFYQAQIMGENRKVPQKYTSKGSYMEACG